MKDDILKTRIKAAKSLDQKLQKIRESLKQIPSYSGKARFMDKAINASREAQTLLRIWNSIGPTVMIQIRTLPAAGLIRSLRRAGKHLFATASEPDSANASTGPVEVANPAAHLS